jgi:hypothetical protein
MPYRIRAAAVDAPRFSPYARHMAEFRWPSRMEPGRARIHVSNELTIEATPERLWGWLIRAPLWPTWYPHCSNVRLDDGARDLHPNATFHWSTNGAPLATRVTDFEPHTYLAWTAVNPFITAHHAWRLEKTPAGTHVTTEETQRGILTIAAFRIKPMMLRVHQTWLERLAAVSTDATPP